MESLTFALREKRRSRRSRFGRGRPGLTERRGIGSGGGRPERSLYELRLDVDYDGVAISRASAEAGVHTVQQTLAAIDQHTPGGDT